MLTKSLGVCWTKLLAHRSRFYGIEQTVYCSSGNFWSIAKLYHGCRNVLVCWIKFCGREYRMLWTDPKKLAVVSLWSIAKAIFLLVRWTSAREAEWFLQQPNWLWWRISNHSTNSIKRLCMIFSKNLKNVGKSEIGLYIVIKALQCFKDLQFWIWESA